MDRTPGDRRGALTRGVLALAWVLGTLVVAGAVFLGSFIAGMKGSMRATAVDVPDLGNRTVQEARDAAAAQGLEVEIASERHSAEIASGRVINQDPPAGLQVRRGRTVKLTLSLGAEVLVVPRVVGRGDREVALELRRAGLAPGDVTGVRHASAPEGRVLGQVPPAGSPALPGTRVHRLVSAGRWRPAWVMPDLVGLAHQDAERWLRFSGLRLGPTREVPADGRPVGTVIGQLPPSGHPVRTTDLVEITVAR